MRGYLIATWIATVEEWQLSWSLRSASDKDPQWCHSRATPLEPKGRKRERMGYSDVTHRLARHNC